MELLLAWSTNSKDKIRYILALLYSILSQEKSMAINCFIGKRFWKNTTNEVKLHDVELLLRSRSTKNVLIFIKDWIKPVTHSIFVHVFTKFHKVFWSCHYIFAS